MGLRIRLLGTVDLEVGGVPVALPPGRRLRALTGWLALHPGGQPRARLAARLWPDVPDASARASLRSALWALRGTLGPHGAPALMTDRDSAGFRRAGLTVDAAEFERLAGAGRLADAVALCRGELLAELDDDWVFEAREQHAQRLASVLGRLAGQAAAAGDRGAATTWARRRAELFPLDEAAGRDLIQRIADSDDLPGALVAYGQLRRRLRDELGLGPSRATRQLAARLRAQRPPARAGHPARPPGHPASAAGHGPPGPPVTQASTTGGRWLAGRGEDLATLTAAWQACRAGPGRVVVLSGEGGIGKTSLTTALLAHVRQQQALTVMSDAGAAHPFGLWPEVLSGVLAGSGGPPPQARWAADLAALHPAFGPPPPASLLGAHRGRLFEAVVALLAWVSRRRPLVLALDDLHLADAPSLALLGYVGRRAAGMRMLLILGRRHFPPRPGLEAALAGMRARGVIRAELTLASLPAGTVRHLAHRAAQLGPAEADRVVAVSGGNPLLAVETARALERGDLPGGLRDAITAASRGLHPAARRFLEFTALAGRDLRQSDVAALPLADPAAAATEALGCGLLHPDGEPIGYRHPLLRDAVSRQIPGPMRGHLDLLLSAALSRGAPPTLAPAARRVSGGHQHKVTACPASGSRSPRSIPPWETWRPTPTRSWNGPAGPRSAAPGWSCSRR